MNLERLLLQLEQRHPGEPEFLQSVRDLLSSVEDRIRDDFRLDHAGILDRLTEPDRILIFKVPWMNDQGKVMVNRGYRVQYNNALGPYKGGLRFHPQLTLGTVKMLAFEQVFKNSLTGLSLGGAMGGADFNPCGKSDEEIMRFCQSFMLEMWHVLGPDIDIPGSDIGVSGREIGYLFGMLKKLTRRHNGTFSGKGPDWGGIRLRQEAPGYGIIYFVKALLESRGDTLQGKTIAVSGFGNVAHGVIERATALGARVVTISGPDGCIHDPEGISGDKLNYLVEMRASNADLVRPYSMEFPGTVFYQNENPWKIPCDIAIPCAIQNELDEADALKLITNGCQLLVEGANRPCTSMAVEAFENAGLTFVPGKAVNGGGVVVSALELAQNTMKMVWSDEEVDQRLQTIMQHTFQLCRKHGTEDGGKVNFQRGANLAAFQRVTEAMIDQGLIG